MVNAHQYSLIQGKNTLSSMLDAALDYAERGWPIFPARADKTPYTDDGVVSATTNKKKIKAWWGKWPKANIALDVGSAGMMVIDLDPGHDIGELEKNIGDLPKTKLHARTPRGGKHLFYELAEGETVPLSASKLAKHVDVRSFHSYVLLEPSRTADGDYLWEGEGKPAYRSDAMKEKACEVKERVSGWDDWLIEPDIPENVALAINWLKNDAKIAIEGVNGDHMAYSTAAMCKSYGLSPQMALDLMWEHWSPRCEPPWSADEIDHLEQKIENGYSYNTSAPGNMTPAYKLAKASALFKPVSRDTEGGGEELRAGRFRMVDRDAMDEIKPPKWLIKDTIPQNSYALLVGPRGTFKTFIALDMALSVATGSPYEDWRGLWPDISGSGPVLFAAGEGRGNIVQRVRAWESYHMDGDKTHNLYLIDPVPSPSVEDVTPFIEMALKREDQYSLVVMDTVGRAMQGLNENSQQDVSMFTRMVETIQHELDCAVLAIHHSGHDNTGRARGSSVFGADVDAEFNLDRDDKEYVVRLKNSKQKDAPEWEQPRIIKLKELKISGGKSLVATAPNEAEAAQAVNKTPEKKKDKKTQENKINLQLLGKLTRDILKQNKALSWSQTGLAKAIAVMRSEGEDEPIIGVGWKQVNNYLTDLRQSPHPSHKYYDPMGRGKWEYKK